MLSGENAHIRSLEAKTETEADGALAEMTVDVRDKKHLEKLVSTMRRISGVRHASEYGIAYLRGKCPCATCTGAHRTPPRQPESPPDAASPFQMYKPALKMLSVEPVGN